MKFLVDAQLPPRLCDWLRSQSHQARHVSAIEQGLTLSDRQIWNIAKAEKEIIISKDRDFYDRALISEKPPQILHLALGNCSVQILIGHILKKWPTIEKALAQGVPMVSVTKTHVHIFE